MSHEMVTSHVCKLRKSKRRTVVYSMATIDNKRKRVPGKRCVVMFCNKTNADVSLHQFPKEKTLRQKWVNFVLQKRDPKSWQPGSGYVCSDHFKLTDFEGYMAKIAGFSSKLVLKKEAYPTVNSVPNADVFEENKDYHKTRKRLQCSPKKRTALTKINAHRTLDVVLKTVELEEIASSVEPCSSLAQTSCFPVQSNDESNVEQVQGTENKATQKSYKKPKRRSKGTQADIHVHVEKEYKDAEVQCNLCNLPFFKDQLIAIEEKDDLDLDLGEDDIKCLDEDYILPSQSDSENTDSEEENIQQESKASSNELCTERKFLIFESCLLSLFETCPVCGDPAKGSVDKITGSMIRVLHQCQQDDCTFQCYWYSQPSLGNMPVGNLLISTSMLLSGCCIAKSLRLFKFLNMASISSSTFYRHSRSYVSPTIIQQWKVCQQQQIDKLSNTEGGLVLAGDGRCDSPGYCAKFGSFTLIEQRINKVLDFQLVQSNEVKNSAWMENEGLVRSINVVTNAGLNVAEIITDRHKQNAAWIRKNLPTVKHYFDIWHVSKGLCKKIDKLATKHDCKDISYWRDSISNHMYWCAASTPEGDGQTMQEKWKILPLHIQNIHTNLDSPVYKECGHGDLQGDAKLRLWLEPGSTAAVKLEELLLSRQLLKYVSQLSPVYQTSSLEAKHSLDIHYVPKHTSFSYWGMYTRLCLSALHYNTNSDRVPKLTQGGTIRYAIRYPKSKKGKHSVRPIKEDPIYDYCSDLIDEVFTKYQENAQGLKNYMKDIKVNTPPPLAASMQKPDKTAAINNFVTRYNKTTIIH